MKIKFLDGSEKEFNSLRGADLHGANLYRADLSGADLSDANLSGADLSGLDFRRTNLRRANLYRTNLRRANLYRANLSDANLSGANLYRADLSGANLYGANLTGAGLSGVDLTGLDLPHFQICPSEGSFIGWKKTTTGIIKLLIPEHAKRTSSLVGRKCRASSVIPLEGDGIGGYSLNTGNLLYQLNVEVFADKFDDDIRVECTHGIHFFITREEALEWD